MTRPHRSGNAWIATQFLFCSRDIINP